MKLSIEGIKNTTDWEKAGIKLPSYDVEKVAEDTKKSPVWVHFGIGNIFRIFIGGIADSLLEQGVSDKGITCVETFDFDVVDKIYKPFDNLVMAGGVVWGGGNGKRMEIQKKRYLVHLQKLLRHNHIRRRNGKD